MQVFIQVAGFVADLDVNVYPDLQLVQSSRAATEQESQLDIKHFIQAGGTILEFKTYPSKHVTGTVFEIPSQFLPPSVIPTQTMQSFIESEPIGEPNVGIQEIQSDNSLFPIAGE